MKYTHPKWMICFYVLSISVALVLLSSGCLTGCLSLSRVSEFCKYKQHDFTGTVFFVFVLISYSWLNFQFHCHRFVRWIEQNFFCVEERVCMFWSWVFRTNDFNIYKDTHIHTYARIRREHVTHRGYTHMYDCTPWNLNRKTKKRRAAKKIRTISKCLFKYFESFTS